MSGDQMAKELGLQRKNLDTLRKSKTYLDLFERLRVQREKAVESAQQFSTIQIRTRLANYTKDAVETLYRVMMNPFAKDGDRVGAACEILDRDGRFAKVSRLMNVRQGEDGAPMLPEDAAAEIIEALKAKVTVQ
jgi:hypothetical protein